MKLSACKVGEVWLDSLPFCLGGTYEIAKAWKAAGVAGFIGYLGAMSATRLDYVLRAGLKFMPVTFAGEYKDGAADEISQLRALGVPQGCHVWLDFEGKSTVGDDALAKKLGDLVNAWGRDIRAAGYRSALYVGVPQPFTSAELYSFAVDRYWHGQGSVRDRRGNLAEPFRDWGACRGWNMIQAAPSQTLAGCLVDYNMVYGDYKGDVPVAVSA